ncbi:tripartite tricarboxylate transporter TctB family protein [Rhizobium sp. SL42]|uniref:tripartite tricarboxylate transporter TctB family protein n=1 Tax=Rhizobium sp. SL42 TaxID=2806346 RepID=UPI001F3F5AC7|nr:tripartite tricarboxylate transporter TctB family protein [Rhizobium sp. SL42]UJW74843.1 tripartite tricarboxylate transporter TctB family protein [Rhizobium sp. SL42]
MKSVRLDPANTLCGLLFIGLGLFFVYQSFQLELGTAFRMGPGYFPLVLAIILALLGIVILVQATRVAGEPIGPIAWRGMLFILPAPVVFGLLVRGAGFVPALFVAAFIASFASERLRVPAALALATGITIFSVLVFSYGLGLPFERFGPWLRF